MADFNIKNYCVQQLEKDDYLIKMYEGVYRIKLGFTKQYNNAVKNEIDRERLRLQYEFKITPNRIPSDIKGTCEGRRSNC